MFCMTLRRAYRRTERSLLVKPPSLKTGSPNRFVVTIGTTSPVSASAAWNSSMIRVRSPALEPGGTRSSSWNVMPYAPSSANLCTASTAARTGRVASPKRSRACQPTVHRPKLNLSSRVGLGAIASSCTDAAAAAAVVMDNVSLCRRRSWQQSRGLCAVSSTCVRRRARHLHARPARVAEPHMVDTPDENHADLGDPLDARSPQPQVDCARLHDPAHLPVAERQPRARHRHPQRGGLTGRQVDSRIGEKLRNGPRDRPYDVVPVQLDHLGPRALPVVAERDGQ